MALSTAFKRHGSAARAATSSSTASGIRSPANRVQAAADAATAFVPERKFLDGEPDHVWRNGKPDYTVVNQAYLDGKTKNWQAGSLESLVESVVKTLEMEISHKVSSTTAPRTAPPLQLAEGRSHGQHILLSILPASLAVAVSHTCTLTHTHTSRSGAAACIC